MFPTYCMFYERQSRMVSVEKFFLPFPNISHWVNKDISKKRNWIWKPNVKSGREQIKFKIINPFGLRATAATAKPEKLYFHANPSDGAACAHILSVMSCQLPNVTWLRWAVNGGLVIVVSSISTPTIKTQFSSSEQQLFSTKKPTFGNSKCVWIQCA